MDNLKDKEEKLFQRCAAKKAKIGGADQIYEDIKNEYYKTLEDADEKVSSLIGFALCIHSESFQKSCSIIMIYHLYSCNCIFTHIFIIGDGVSTRVAELL